MVTKVREKEGGGKHPRRLRGLALLLSLVMIFTCAFPFTAQAKTNVTWDGFYCAAFSVDGRRFASFSTATGGTSWSSSDYLQRDVDYLQFSFYPTTDLKADTELFCNIVYKTGRYVSCDVHYSVYYGINGYNSTQKLIYEGDFYNVESDYVAGYGRTLYIPGIPIDRDLFYLNDQVTYATQIWVVLLLSNWTYDYPSSLDLPAAFTFVDLDLSYEQQSTGLLNSIIDWIKGIWEKLVSLPSEIGSFITNLGESIAGFFSNLIGNLQQWFANIGEWFSNLGNAIGGFFENLWINISEFFTSLFLPSEDYFENLRNDLDQHMSDHLGAVYNVPKKLLEHLKEIITGLEAADGSHLIIHFPELAFKLNGERYSLFAGIDYDLLEPINAMDDPTTKSMINVVLLLMHGFIDLRLAISVFKMIYKQIINKVGIEGGSDL